MDLSFLEHQGSVMQCMLAAKSSYNICSQMISWFVHPSIVGIYIVRLWYILYTVYYIVRICYNHELRN